MKSSPSLKRLFSPIGAFIYRFHLIIFTVAVLGGLAVLVLILNNIITHSSNPDSSTTSHVSTTFDEKTANQINQLKTAQDNVTPLVIPPGRSNPFAE